MQITLHLDDETAKQVEQLAAQRHQTIDQTIAELIGPLAARAAAAGAWAEWMRQHPGQPPAGWRFDREECWDRAADRSAGDR